MKLEPFWLDELPPFEPRRPQGLPAQADVVVVGGGFTGLSAALALAERGASVVVLEAGRIVGEASGRNGGQCNTGLATDFGGLAQRIGMDRARAAYLAYEAAVDTVETLAVRHQIDCGFRRCGKLKLAAKPAHYDSMQRQADVLRAHVDPHVLTLPADQLASEIGTDAFHGGLLQTRGARMHVGRFGLGLAQAADRAGAVVLQHQAVTRLERLHGRAHRVHTAQGSIHVGQVLLATGASQVGPFAWLRRRIVPVGSFAVVTEPLADSVRQAIMPGERNCVTSRNVGNYFRLTDDGRLLFGGRARFAMSNPRSDARSGEVLRQAMTELFPVLRDVAITHCWGGLVDMTADRLPRAGERDGLHYAVGYSGHGVQMSVHMGQHMAEVISGAPAHHPWDAGTWPAIPGHFGPPWFLPFVGLYYRLQDVLH